MVRNGNTLPVVQATTPNGARVKTEVPTGEHVIKNSSKLEYLCLPFLQNSNGTFSHRGSTSWWSPLASFANRVMFVDV